MAQQHYQTWTEQSPRGVLLISAGALCLSQATVWRARKCSTFLWMLFGMAGLILLGAGVVIFGESVKHRTLYESKLENGENSH